MTAYFCDLPDVTMNCIRSQKDAGTESDLLT
jgi:hypothetical protein